METFILVICLLIVLGVLKKKLSKLSSQMEEIRSEVKRLRLALPITKGEPAKNHKRPAEPSKTTLPDLEKPLHEPAKKAAELIKDKPLQKEVVKQPSEQTEQAKTPAALPPTNKPDIKKGIANRIATVTTPKLDKASAKVKQDKPKQSLEQVIGTKWVLIAGIITVIVSVGFFLKYAIDNDMIGPLGRVLVVAAMGVAALGLGEFTRRRGYDIVARGVTALGFAILYAADFTAYRYYELMSSTPAFVLAFLITVSAMCYAVKLDEILIAVISLIGGFSTPILVSTGQNQPVPLFIYVLILGIGAVLCATYRKWPIVNVIAFLGTYGLYTGWFESYFRKALRASDVLPEQSAIALGWLTVFFVVYLVLPVLYSLLKKGKARQEDVFLVISNASVVFYYFIEILYKTHKHELAYIALALCMIYFAFSRFIAKRSPDDLPLRIAMVVISTFFLTIAVPLYFDLYTVSIAWSLEAAGLTVIAMKYRSIRTQVSALIVLVLSFFNTISHIPLHKEEFAFILNQGFLSWACIAAAILFANILYRRSDWFKEEIRIRIIEITYSIAVVLLMVACVMEWHYHMRYNHDYSLISVKAMQNYGISIICMAAILLFSIRPLVPSGLTCKQLGMVFSMFGTGFTIYAMQVYQAPVKLMFFNLDFFFAILTVIIVVTAGFRIYRTAPDDKDTKLIARMIGYFIVVGFWIILNQEIYYYYHTQKHTMEKWAFLASMYISVMWAVYAAALMVLGFIRNIAPLRYMSLGLFAVLLFKVFIYDMSTVESVYRILAFLATGIAMVAVSYLYQNFKNKGFFDKLLNEKKDENSK